MAMEGREFSPRDAEAAVNEDAAAEMLFSNRRCCFYIPFRSSSPSPATTTTTLGLNWWQKVRVSDDSRAKNGSLWNRGVNAFKKLREWSEIVAGPRWKTFIRRFNRTKSGGKRSAEFQYDPLSYSLNFDHSGSGNNGDSDEDNDDDIRFRNFSSRYAPTPPPLNRGSITLGKDENNFV